MKNIALKILEVMKDVKSVIKDGKNSFHGYKYVTDAAIVTAIRKELIKNRLIVIPNQIECSNEGDITTLKIQYTLLDVDSGESIISNVYGQGQDKGDKKVYKTATGAEKYFLLKVFLIPTDDDPENEREPRKRVTKEELKSFEESMPPKPENQFIDTKEALSLFALMGQDKARQTAFRNHLELLGISGTNKIPKTRYTEMYEWIIKNSAAESGV